MHFSKHIFVIISLHLCQGAFERDLLLTPKEGLQIHGKRIYYRPGKNETNGSRPWEQTLKHVTYLTLFKNGAGGSKISDGVKYKKFMHSAYTGIHNDYPRFGDIITMAEGWLEESKEYRFIEGPCDRHCNDAALALWRVQKIRHRDAQRGFRYEMKFSVTPLNDPRAKENRIYNGEKYLKSFILKDDDYPESFNALTRRSDFVEIFSNERYARIVNENPNTAELNIGEYFKNIPKATAKIGYHSGAYDVHPTTYRPNYHIRFPKPETYEQVPESPKTVVTHHFHHHFFMNEPEAHLPREQSIYPANLDAIHIVDAPTADILASQYSRLHTTTATPPPSTAAFYMPTNPIFRQASHQDEPTTQMQLTPFKQSEQQIEQIRYSDPDPLYENEGLGTHRFNSQTASAEDHPQVERPQSVAEPQIMKSELAQAGTDKEYEVTEVEEVEETTTIQATSKLDTRSAENTTPKPTPRGYVSKVSVNKFRAYPRSTTEQPVLKWKPKRKPTEKMSEKTSNSPSTQTDVVTVTPSNVYGTDYEILTKKSVSKSVSVKVGNYSQELPLTDDMENRDVGSSSPPQ